MTKAEIFRFDPFLYKTSLKSEHEVVLKDGEKTIYRLVKGDSELDIRKQRDKVTPIRFEVTNYEMVITDETVKRFLKSRGDFGTLIKVFDPLEESKKELEEQTNTIELLGKVASFDDDKVRQVGYVLFGNEAINFMREGNLSALKGKIIQKATSDPDTISKVIENKNNLSKLNTALLIAKGIFEVSVDEREVTWGDNGARIFSVPNGVSALDGLVEFFKTPEGREVNKEAGLRLQTKAASNASKKAEAETDAEDTEEAPARRGRPAANN